ncbi:MAG: acyltransferase [Myxococcota bacterium]
MTGYAEYRAQRTFGSLDGVRCMSIVAVVWHHSHQDLGLGRIATRGFLGVDMFFVLSGFLIVTLLLRERDRNGDISLKAFYARRTLRIMPLYYGVVIGFAAAVYILSPDGKAAQTMDHALPFLLLYLTNWFPVDNLLEVTWSLATEEQFYLLWPPIQKYVRRTVPVLLVLIGLGLLIHLGVFDDMLASFGASDETVTRIRRSPFTPILLGVLLAHILHRDRGFDVVNRLVGHRWSPVMLLAALLIAVELLPQDLTGWPRFSIHLIMTALLASLVVREDHAMAGVLSWRPIVRIGVLSYGMYLLHMFVVAAAERVWERAPLPTFLLFPAVLLGTVLVAELSFRYYETPFLKLKKRFAR